MKRLLFLCLIFIITIPIVSCAPKRETDSAAPGLPYPDARGAQWIQAQVDSSRFTWFLDPKATTSAFCNEYSIFEKNVSTADITIKTEGIFRATAEVVVGDKKMEVTLERPFKERDKNSIWQVVNYKKVK